MLEYQKVLNTQRDATDPWKELANAIVEQAAEDYRRLMAKKIKCGNKMSDLEMRILNSRILEIKLFFESDWGYLCSHGLAPVIWERLQKEFEIQNAETNAAIAVMSKTQGGDEND